MAKYEINLLVRGSLSEKDANAAIANIVAPIKKQKNFKEDAWGNKVMSYKIKKESSAYYFIYTFDCEEPAILVEFRRLCNISDAVLRSLIINIEKTYGYNASVNPTKIKKAALKNKKYKKHQDDRKAEKAGMSTSAILDINSVDEEEDIVENE
ncbi:MAG: hypothetical protein Ta2E_03120 [Mycoplasmoidaceae bacterium]|nr:MAG: hypothetical protein Ta2E_03120 [Mycoplasmoidaceae bacterium]